MARRLAVRLTVAAAVGVAAAVWLPTRAIAAIPQQRIISLIPAATEMLFAIGAGADVVGVSAFDRYPAEAATRPKVGGLLDPNTERILSLQPTLVVLYDTQVELRQRLDRAGIATFPYRHGSIADIYDTILGLGGATHHVPQADAVARRMRAEMSAIAANVEALPRVPTLFVVGRDPGELRHVYVAGGQGFLNDLVELAGGRNVFADIARVAAEVSTEQILSRHPDVVVELWSNRSLDRKALGSEAALWNRLAALPAVRAHRVVEIADDRLAIPGPRLPDGVRLLSSALHP
jgi:cobalamin transport system substrate-binding protein